MSKIIVAHEIGHTCGLRDIYYVYPQIGNIMNEPASERNLPDDWGSTASDLSFYSHTNQWRIIDGLLMMGNEYRQGMDIPFGSVYGLWYVFDEDWRRAFSFSQAPMGVTTGFNRHPCSE